MKLIHITPCTITPLNKYQYFHYHTVKYVNWWDTKWENSLKVMDLGPRGFCAAVNVTNNVVDDIERLRPAYIIMPKMSLKKIDEIASGISYSKIVHSVLDIEEFRNAMNNVNVDVIMLHRYMIYTDRKNIIGEVIRGLSVYTKPIWLDEIIEHDTEIVASSQEPIITHLLTDVVYNFASRGMIFQWENVLKGRINFLPDDSFNNDFKPILIYNQMYLECVCEGIKPPSFTSFLKGDI